MKDNKNKLAGYDWDIVTIGHFEIVFPFIVGE
jgi:hypothetical protein